MLFMKRFKIEMITISTKFFAMIFESYIGISKILANKPQNLVNILKQTFLKALFMRYNGINKILKKVRGLKKEKEICLINLF